MKTRIDSIVNRLVSSYVNDTLHNGLSIGILFNREIYTYNYGTRERGKQLLPDRNTVYEVGSVSKTFAGTLLAQALADGKMKLDDDIRKYLKGNYPNLEYQGQPIRISHLANHTSRLPKFMPDLSDIFKHPGDSIPILFAANDRNNHYTREEFFRDLHKVKIDTFPGYNYSYSNPGAQVAGFILENVYHRTFGELVEIYITKPLGMNHTSVAAPKAGVNLAKGYDFKGRGMPYNVPLALAAGGILSSVSDMLAYIKFHMNEKNKAAALSHQPNRRDTTDDSTIGLYWRISNASGKNRQIWHTGGTLGFASYCVIYPGSKTGMVLLSNESGPDSQGLLIDIADQFYSIVSK